MANANIRHEVFCFTRYNIQRILGSPKLYLILIILSCYILQLVFCPRTLDGPIQYLSIHKTNLTVLEPYIVYLTISLYSNSSLSLFVIGIFYVLEILRNGIGFFPYEFAHLNAYQNLKNLADIRGIIGPDEIRQSISAVGLDPNSNKKVGKFYLGMRQKLGIAQAIMENPDILILDEPFNGLDKDSVKEMRSLLLSLRDAGKLILLASHNPLDISLLCDSAFEIDRGMLFPFEITKSQNVVE